MDNNPQLVTAAVAVVAGVAGQALARRLKLPAILPLLLIGVTLGPSALGIIDPDTLGGGLHVLVGFAVAIILFEGGLSLKPSAFRTAGTVIRNLVTIGALITWAGCSALAYFLFPQIGPGLCILFGSLVIVTGPTVIQPLLNSVRPRQRIGDVLRGEAILIDPVGALLAVLVFEYLTETESAGAGHAFLAFGKRMGLGAVLGAGGAGLLYWLLCRPKMLARDLRNLGVVAGAIGLFALSEMMLSESGVLTVTLAGFLLGIFHPPGLEEIEEFKGQLTTMMVSIVFVLLSAHLDMNGLLSLGVPGVLLVLGIILIVRPLTVFLCTIGTELTTQEKLFLSWIAPRGIVAAAVSSLFALVLTDHGDPNGGVILSLTFAVIAGTVIIQAPTARWVGKALGVLEGSSNGILFIGANRVSRGIARGLDRAGYRIQLVDTSAFQVEEARKMGLNAVRANAIDPIEIERLDFHGIGHVITATPSDSVNRIAMQVYGEHFGPQNVRTLKMANSPNDASNSGEHVFLNGDELTWESLNHAFNEGQVVSTLVVDHEMPIGELGEFIEGAKALVAFTETGEIRMLHKSDRLEIGDRLFFVAPPATEE
jgi:NhaP-type Na+/H+ or K+/H+ antiporter